jgi:hypothetical protein
MYSPTSELYTLKWLTLCHINFRTIKNLPKKGTTWHTSDNLSALLLADPWVTEWFLRFQPSPTDTTTFSGSREDSPLVDSFSLFVKL